MGKARLCILASASLATVFVLYAFSVASHFGINIIWLEGRAMLNHTFNAFVFSELADHVIIVSAATLWILTAVRRRILKFSLAVVYGSLAAISSVLGFQNVLEDLALVTVPVITTLIVYDRKVSVPKKIFVDGQSTDKSHDLGLVLNYALLFAVIIGAISLFTSISQTSSVNPQASPGLNYVNPQASAGVNYVRSLFLLLSLPSTIYIVVLANAVGAKLLYNAIWEKVHPSTKPSSASDHVADRSRGSTDINALDPKQMAMKSRGSVQQGQDHFKLDRVTDGEKRIVAEIPSKDQPGAKISSRRNAVYLALTMILSSALVAIPHIPLVNPQHLNVGDDTPAYVGMLSAMAAHSSNAQNFLNQAFSAQMHGDRPISLIVLYGFVNLINPNQHTVSATAIEYFPIILAPALVVAVYFLTRELLSTGKDQRADQYRRAVVPLLAAFLTSVSAQAFFALGGGIYSNWLALSIGYFSVGFLFRFLRKPSVSNFAIYFGLLLTVLFTHVYTFVMLIAIMGVFLGVVFTITRRKKISPSALLGGFSNKTSTILIPLASILGFVVIEAARIAVTGSSGLSDLGGIAQAGLGQAQYLQHWNTLNQSILLDGLGVFSNFIILGLALYWLFRFRVWDKQTIFLVIFLSFAIIPLYFGDWISQTRTLYNIPFQIPAAIALGSLISKGTEPNVLRERGRATLLLVASCLWLVSMAVFQGINIVPNFNPT